MKLPLHNRFSALEPDSNLDSADTSSEVQSKSRKPKSTRRPERSSSHKDTAVDTVSVLAKEPCIIVDISIGGINTEALGDSGAKSSCLSKTLGQRINLKTRPTYVRVVAANSTNLHARLATDVQFSVLGSQFSRNFCM